MHPPQLGSLPSLRKPSSQASLLVTLLFLFVPLCLPRGFLTLECLFPLLSLENDLGLLRPISNVTAFAKLIPPRGKRCLLRVHRATSATELGVPSDCLLPPPWTPFVLRA